MVVHRVEIHPTAHAGDPRADTLLSRASDLGYTLDAVHSARVYLIEAALTDAQLDNIISNLLCNPVVERAEIGASQPRGSIVEIHPLPGVMDPPAQSVADAIEALTGIRAEVSTGYRYDLIGVSDAKAQTIANRLLANPVVAGVHAVPFHPEELPKGHSHEFKLTHVNIRDLDDAGLEKLSREGHLFLSLEEMKAIQHEYKTLNREPTDIELETLAQTWSEHCVHKTLKANINYTGPAIEGIDWSSRPHHRVNDDGSITISNLLKATVAAATFELIDEGIDWTQSVFVDNAGIIKFDDDHSVCIKVETHNHPSALEPYGGAATGIGGCIRDIIGTGLAAKPIASTDVFCVAHPETETVPAGCLPPRQILTQIVAGVRDYGNRMGIPTINGAVSFDNRYIGNPLVYCGCIGIMPSHLISGDAKPGDRIIALGGRTGRDGIHGATFSSAELTDTHADEFSHAVQIGNAIEEKRTLDAILRARDAEGGPLYSAITDCGAGGFSSAVGEMGEKIGAFVELDKAPLKYAGLSYTEIWISEAQERMVIAVPEKNLHALQKICDEEHVELANLGYFGTDGAQLILNYNTHEVGRLPMHFMHDGIPMSTRNAVWQPKPTPAAPATSTSKSANEQVLELLSHPNIASKHWIVRQYDHQVQGNTVIKPLNGPQGIGPSDASVIEPVPGTGQGLAVGCGLATGLSDDPYAMTLAAIDECVRNLVCTGTDPDRIAILDNFCWPSCGKEENLGSLVRAAHACYDGAKAYKAPFVSGKDSLNNQFTTEDGVTIEIPPTLLITGMGIVHDLGTCVTSDAKSTGNTLVLVGNPQGKLTGSHAQQLGFAEANGMPSVDLVEGPKTAHAIHTLIENGLVRSAHDVSDGGVVCAIAEMLIAGSSSDAPIGFDASEDLDWALAYDESPSCYVLEVEDENAVRSALGDIPLRRLGTLSDSGRMTWDTLDASVEELTRAWRSPLDW
ncbi:MAG: phosphoribosylformylglycinamidine synthase [Phycisphaerae bacterium]|nr:phosphoribosylformylglycinamidine synthase [Phycisphaerae bacterium]MBM91002.1 phosphoribosylformylglycinamidine synthase [Phycisphaerae bacterium]